MSTLEFGDNKINSADDYIKEIYTLIGENFPLTVTTMGGVLKQVLCETSWLEGGTIPVESISESGELTVTYQESYEEKSLTQEQLDKLDIYMKENIV